MAKPPPDDNDRITDLRRYRKEREQRAKRRPAPSRPPGQSFLGSNPRALPILILVLIVIALLYILPRFL